MSDDENIFDDVLILTDDVLILTDESEGETGDIDETDEKYIYLTSGNWFELKGLKYATTKPYNIEAFKNEIIAQVSDRANKLDFIDIKFMPKYKNYHIEQLVFYLDKFKFDRMIDMLLSETRHPMLTFHGTTNHNVVMSIINNGYIIPGKDIAKQHGSVYGEGIYSSPHAEKALCYTNVDNSKNVYLLINIVFLGTVKLIPSGPVSLPILQDNCYTDGTHTRVVYGLEQLVSADPHKIIPIGYIKIKI
jgi:hypothetical protein